MDYLFVGEIKAVGQGCAPKARRCECRAADTHPPTLPYREQEPWSMLQMYVEDRDQQDRGRSKQIQSWLARFQGFVANCCRIAHGVKYSGPQDC